MWFCLVVSPSKQNHVHGTKRGEMLWPPPVLKKQQKKKQPLMLAVIYSAQCRRAPNIYTPCSRQIKMLTYLKCNEMLHFSLVLTRAKHLFIYLFLMCFQMCVLQRWEVKKYKYFVPVSLYVFQISVLNSVLFSENLYFLHLHPNICTFCLYRRINRACPFCVYKAPKI